MSIDIDGEYTTLPSVDPVQPLPQPSTGIYPSIVSVMHAFAMTISCWGLYQDREGLGIAKVQATAK